MGVLVRNKKEYGQKRPNRVVSVSSQKDEISISVDSNTYTFSVADVRSGIEDINDNIDEIINRLSNIVEVST